MSSFDQDIAESMQRYYATGDGIHLLWTIRNCGQYQIPIPHEVRIAFEEALVRYGNAEVRTLDEAFAVSRPKGWNQSSERTKRSRVFGVSKAFAIYRRVRELSNNGNGAPIDMELFDRVGNEFLVSGSTARKYYREVKKTLADE